ncbi:RDD family protein [Paramicrobacterium agarici]|uniref:FHA domain-containing protein n=1 Tax=Paramicrobacterium agarici TaxID=630514 RepID=A0A2A9DWH5_9MICO|nr:RDD family protein [Microbacterium agarici]PFG30342.1 FHA domain-containing protein [Microbacterium agarici]
MTVADGRRARREAEQRAQTTQTMRDPAAEKAAQRAHDREARAEALLIADELGVITASWGRRSLAYFVDIVCYLIVASPGLIAAWFLIAGANWARPGLDVFTKQPNFLLLLIIMLSGLLLGWIFIIVEVALHGLKGLTIGKALAGIRSVSVVLMRKPGFWRIVLRTVILQASNVVLPLIGPAVILCSSLWSERGIGWLDRVSKSRVIDVRLGLNPLDLKALRRAERRIARPERIVETDLPSLATHGSPDAHFAPSARSRLGVVGENPILPPGERREDWAGDAPQTSPSSGGAPQPQEPQRSQVSAPHERQAPTAREPQAPAPAAQASYVVEGAGVSADITSVPALLGRNPQAREGENVNLVPVNDPSHSMSKTHALLGTEPRGVWIEDRGSANGTVIVLPDGSEQKVEPFAPVMLGGSVVRCGDCEFRVMTKGARQ